MVSGVYGLYIPKACPDFACSSPACVETATRILKTTSGTPTVGRNVDLSLK